MTKDKKKAAKSLEPRSVLMAAPAGVNLIASPIQINPISTFGVAPLAPGLPIMREGFITETGFLPTNRS